MTLEERIAKRKAEGWELSHWVLKRKDGLYLSSSIEWDTLLSKAVRLRDGRLWPEWITVEHTGKAKKVPVFTRTIKVKRRRTYSFWQTCKMAMAGKKMRMCDPERDLVMTVGAVTRKVVWRVSAETVPVSEENINARWEIAE